MATCEARRSPGGQTEASGATGGEEFTLYRARGYQRQLRKGGLPRFFDNGWEPRQGDYTQGDRRWCLPYGKWHCDDGREVLFDRRYGPIAEKYPGKPATLVDPFQWVDDITNREKRFYNDATPERDKCRAALVALEDWEITDEVLAELKKRLWCSPSKGERGGHG